MNGFLDALSLLAKKRTLAWLVVHEAVALLLCLWPPLRLLAGTPGFEFAFVQNILVALSAGHLGVMAAARAREVGPAGSARALVGRAYAGGLVASLVVLSLPLVTVLVAGIWNGLCSYSTGLAFYAILPAASAFLGAAFGVLFGLAIPRRFLGMLAYLAVALCSLGASIAWLSTQAPIFVYDPFFGHFPGALYDELLEVRAPMLWFRAETLFLAAGALALACGFAEPISGRLRWRARRMAPLLIAAGAVTAVLLLRVHGGALGYFVSTDDVAAALGGRHETEHFVLHYPTGSKLDARIDEIALDHELRYQQLERTLGARPAGKVHSFLYADPDEKHRLMGARGVSIAKPWLSQTHLHDMGTPHPVLRHELAHVFAKAFGGWFGVSAKGPLHFNVGLIEGLAVAADWSLGPLSGHQWSRGAYDVLGERAPKLEDILGVAGFWGESSALAYTLAGSFARFLLDTYGAARLRDVYRDADFERAYGRPLAELAQEWRAMLAKIELQPRDLRLAERRFRRPSIFRRACGREVARLVDEARKARGRRKLTREVSLRRAACELEQSPSRLLELIDALRRSGNVAEMRELLGKELQQRKGGTLSEALLELRGDLDWREGRLLTARTTYGALLAKMPAPEEARRLSVKIAAIDHPIASPLVRTFLLDDERERALDLVRLHELTLAAPDFAAGHYLMGRHLYFAREYASAGRFLTTAVNKGLHGEELLVETQRVLGLAALAVFDYAGALNNFQAVADTKLAAGLAIEGKDLIERVHFTRGFNETKAKAARERETRRLETR